MPRNGKIAATAPSTPRTMPAMPSGDSLEDLSFGSLFGFSVCSSVSYTHLTLPTKA